MQRDLIPLIVRFIAIFVFFFGFRQLISLMDFVADGQIDRPGYMMGLYFLWAIFPLVGSLLLWLFPRAFFRRLSADEFVGAGGLSGVVDYLRVAIVAIGLFVTIYAVSDLLFCAGEILIFLYSFGEGVSISHEIYVGVFVGSFQLIVGLCFVFFSRRVLRALGETRV